jgi:hypothetical protein
MKRKIIDYILITDALKNIQPISKFQREFIDITKLKYELFEYEQIRDLLKSNFLKNKIKIELCDYFLNLEIDKTHPALDQNMIMKIKFIFNDDFEYSYDGNELGLKDKSVLIYEMSKLGSFQNLLNFINRIIRGVEFILSEIDKEEFQKLKQILVQINANDSKFEEEFEKKQATFNTLVELQKQTEENRINFFNYQIQKYSDEGYELQGGFYLRDYIGYQAMVKYED